jgi:tetratricopeptide (TPR) repeat protein
MQVISKRALFLLLVALLATVLVACGSPEEKRAKFLKKGQALYEKGDYVKARLEFKNAIQIDPKFAEAYYMLGMVQLKQGDLKPAFGRFSKAAELSPDHLNSHLQIGKLFLVMKEPEKAMEKAELILEKDPKNEEALILKGSVLLAQKETNKTITLFNGLMEKGIKRPDVCIMLGSAYFQQKDIQNAEKVLKIGIQTHPESVSLHMALANFYGKSGRMDEALAAFKKVIELEPDRVEHQFKLAGLLWDS